MHCDVALEDGFAKNLSAQWRKGSLKKGSGFERGDERIILENTVETLWKIEKKIKIFWKVQDLQATKFIN